MNITNGIYTDDLQLDSYEVDPFYHAHTAYYFRVMQEAAGAHAYHRGLSIPHLQKEGLTWVVTRTRMRIAHYVTWPNTLQVRTWPQQPWKLYFPRVCRLFDHEGTALFESLSHWVVMDLERQRPVKPTSISDRFEIVDTEETVDPDLGKRVVFEAGMFEQIIAHEPKILYTDCDFNRHVNNVRYLEWMLDSLPFTFRDTHLATEVDISYLAQTFRDDTLLVHTGVKSESVFNDEQPVLFHEVVRISKEGERQQVCVASTTWTDRNRLQ
jgi:acyl-ACP thioesterase